MSSTDKISKYYAECTQGNTKPEHEVDEELTKQLTHNYRTLPSFEKTFFDHIHIKHYSLQRHELLKCRWGQYKKHIEERVKEPFLFPDNRDLHFYNASIRFLPQLSQHRFPEYRMKLKPGPGVDHRGQMPIPQELLMKRGRPEKEAANKKIVRKLKKSGIQNEKNIEKNILG